MTVQARNRYFETITLIKAFLEALFYKNFACFAVKKHTFTHQNFGWRIVFQNSKFLLAQFLYIYIYSIIYYYY